MLSAIWKNNAPAKPLPSRVAYPALQIGTGCGHDAAGVRIAPFRLLVLVRVMTAAFGNACSGFPFRAAGVEHIRRCEPRRRIPLP
jgi:hypothetical protein